MQKSSTSTIRLLFAKGPCTPSQLLRYWKKILHRTHTSNHLYTQLYILLVSFLFLPWFLSEIITINGKTSEASEGFHPLIFPFCQEMLMFKGIMFLALFGFIKSTMAGVLQRHRFFKLWRSLKSFPSSILKIYSFSLIMLQQRRGKVKKVIRMWPEKHSYRKKYHPTHLG